MPVKSTAEVRNWQDDFLPCRPVLFETLPLRPQGLFCTLTLP